MKESTESLEDHTRRNVLKSTGLMSTIGVAGVTGLSIASQPTLAVTNTTKLPTGLVEGEVDIASYEIQYSDLDTDSDITLEYIFTVDGSLNRDLDQSFSIPISEQNGAVMTGEHSITSCWGSLSASSIISPLDWYNRNCV